MSVCTHPNCLGLHGCISIQYTRSDSWRSENSCHMCPLRKSVGDDKHKMCSIDDTDYLALMIKESTFTNKGSTRCGVFLILITLHLGYWHGVPKAGIRRGVLVNIECLRLVLTKWLRGLVSRGTWCISFNSTIRTRTHVSGGFGLIHLCKNNTISQSPSCPIHRNHGKNLIWPQICINPYYTLCHKSDTCTWPCPLSLCENKISQRTLHSTTQQCNLSTHQHVQIIHPYKILHICQC